MAEKKTDQTVVKPNHTMGLVGGVLVVLSLIWITYSLCFQDHHTEEQKNAEKKAARMKALKK